jgi:hypothetical protein
MSVVKSSALNLYDSVSGNNHFQTKVSSDRVDIQISSVPLYLKGTSLHLTNVNGNAITDVVETILGIIQTATNESAGRVIAINDEATDRLAADAVLQIAIDQKGVDSSSAIAAETLVRVAAEDALGVLILEEKAARQAAVTSEISARATGDQNLDTLLTSEVSARQAAVLAELTARSAADSTLQSNINGEASLRTTADGVLQSNLDQEVIDRTSAVSAEAALRVSGDATLQSALDAEVLARTTADTTLQTNIATAVSQRITAVANEATARSDADNTIATSVLTETNARIAEVAGERSRIDALLAGTTIDLNQLQELVNAYTTSDASILSQISTITTTMSAIQIQLDGTDSVLNTLIADIASTNAPAPVKTKFPLSPLTEDSRVTSSITSNDDDEISPYRAFDNIYGENAVGVYADPSRGGWYSSHNDSTSSLLVNGTQIVGHYVYLDLGPDSSNVVISSFQLYSMLERFPIEYRIVGSNDKNTWKSLYHTTSAVVDGSIPHGTDNAAYTSEISMGHAAYYRYVGVLVVTREFYNSASHTSVQELLLYGMV